MCNTCSCGPDASRGRSICVSRVILRRLSCQSLKFPIAWSVTLTTAYRDADRSSAFGTYPAVGRRRVGSRVSGRRTSTSLRLDLGLFDHPPPLLGLGGDELAELLRAHQ